MKRYIIGLIALSAPVAWATTAQAATVDDVPWIIQNSGGRYVYGGASLAGADCSGLVSVAQSLATGQEPRRLGNTHTLLAGGWPGVRPGATPGDRFVIGVNAGHMVAQVDGVNIESTTAGSPYKVGAGADSPWSGRYQLYHVDPALLVSADPIQVLPTPPPPHPEELPPPPPEPPLPPVDIPPAPLAPEPVAPPM
jgi:hypothetical protein